MGVEISNDQLPTANFQVACAKAKGHLKIGSWKLVIGHSLHARRSLGGGWLTGNNTTRFVLIVPILKFV